jgi:hypothetical protein
MSPEQALGAAEKIGPCTDGFGLGGILFHLLTGRPVYQSTSRLGALMQASEGDQLPPRSFNPKVPSSLDRICRKALAPDPNQRYRAADELERALRRFLRRPWLVAAGAMSLGVAALGYAAMQMWAPIVSQPAGVSGIAGPAANMAVPWIVSFEVEYFRREKPPRSLGLIGESTEPALFNDDVQVRSRLDAPAYFYLIALNADGKVQLCHPPEETESPSPSDAIVYPRSDYMFPLNDGVGLQAFILVVSRQPLPPFAEWKGREGLQWEIVPAEGAGVWSFDGRSFKPLARQQRGNPRKLPGVPELFKNVCEQVAKLQGPDAVRAVTFPVGRPRN